jgi:hypothetical protein
MAAALTPNGSRAGTVWQVNALCIVNALVPFSTRLADDGLVHVRAWRTSAGPVIVVAELDWAMLTHDPSDAYYGPGIFTYPQYALPAARTACDAAGISDGRMFVRLPAPPGERFARVVDPDDPQGWEPVEAHDIAALVGTDQWPGPPPGAYVQRHVAAWVATGVSPQA